MLEISLCEFGFAGKKFLCDGNVVEKKEGTKLLFLFAETHKRKTSIGPNVRNCIRLADEGVVKFVGLEYNPKDEISPAKYRRTEDLAGDVEAIIQADLEQVMEPRFGTTIRRLSDISVEVIEDMELWTATGEIESEIKERHFSKRQRELFDKLKEENPGVKDIVLDLEAGKQAEMDPEVIKQFRDEFGDHPNNKRRDDAMVGNLIARWAEVGTDNAVILNAGRKHIQRIKNMLPPGVGFISVAQPE